ncbi:putative transposon Ty3-I Gag-Pol polyprotein, partial [Operophtera brumata]
MPSIQELQLVTAGDKNGVLSQINEEVAPFMPELWKSWEVQDFTPEQLLGDPPDPKILNKLRFAVPTLALAQAFGLSDLSEKTYKSLKLKLMCWPFTRALIYAPHSLAMRIHGDKMDQFLEAAKRIKPRLWSRQEVDNHLRNLSASSSTSSKRRRTAVSLDEERETREEEEADERRSPRRVPKSPIRPAKSHDDVLAKALAKQSDMFQAMMGTFTAAVSKLADSQGSTRGLRPATEDSSVSEINVYSSSDSESDTPIREDDFSRLLPPMQNTASSSMFEAFSFEAATAEAEPHIPKATDHMLAKGLEIQRLNSENWSNLRYREAEKALHASPVFVALKVNPQLASLTQKWCSSDTLTKYDHTLGVLTHGLLMQREAFKDAIWSVGKEGMASTQAMSDSIQRNLLSPDSTFHKVTDQILQYVCGRRADVLTSRRLTYSSPNVAMDSILQTIPPSATHLFNEEKLTEALKVNGGFHRFFPSKRGTWPGGKKQPGKREFRKSDRGRQDQPKKAKGPKDNRKSRQNEGKKMEVSCRGSLPEAADMAEPGCECNLDKYNKWLQNSFYQKTALNETLLEYLGIVWDTRKNIKYNSDQKQKAIRSQIKDLIKTKRVSWLGAKSVLGRLIFAAFVVKQGKLHCRFFQRDSNRMKRYPESKLYALSPETLQEWWLDHLKIVTPIHHDPPTVFITTDASDIGWGAVVNGLKLQGAWNQRQRSWHCNRKEMWAVYHALNSNKSVVEKNTCLIQSDNKTVVAYIQKEGGTKSLILHSLVKKIFLLTNQLKITLLARYIPGRFNETADSLSRGKGLPEWSLTRPIVDQIFQRWGTPQIDLFASERSAVVPVYATENPLDRKALYVDAFTRIWKWDLAWVFPPPYLMPQVLSRGDIYNSVSTVAPGVLESRLEIESHSSTDSNKGAESEPVRQEYQRAPPENQGISIGDLAGTGWARQIEAWPQEDQSLLVSSWRGSTLKTYNKAWSRWKLWAEDNSCSCTDPTAEQVARYLCFLHRSEKLAPATILVHKSVVCTFANPLKSEAISADPLVRHVLKGISLSREKSVKKRTIWSLDFILAWLAQRTVEENSLYDVSRHVALLLLLHSGRRLHDLTLLRISSESLSFPKLISVSESRRSARNNLISLFITTRGCVREASRTVIGGWIKKSFKEANLNASPGSIRAAVANDNFTIRNLDIDDVISKAKGLTHRFYALPSQGTEEQASGGAASDEFDRWPHDYKEKSVKKRTIWSLDFILAWLAQRTVEENSLYDVSRHVALLLLLHSGRRLHDLTLLRISEFSSDGKFLTFWPEFGSKSDSSFHRQSGWLIKNNEVQIFDRIYWIKKLISVSESRRSARINLISS